MLQLQQQLVQGWVVGVLLRPVLPRWCSLWLAWTMWGTTGWQCRCGCRGTPTRAGVLLRECAGEEVFGLLPQCVLR